MCSISEERLIEFARARAQREIGVSLSDTGDGSAQLVVVEIGAGGTQDCPCIKIRISKAMYLSATFQGTEQLAIVAFNCNAHFFYRVAYTLEIQLSRNRTDWRGLMNDGRRLRSSD